MRITDMDKAIDLVNQEWWDDVWTLHGVMDDLGWTIDGTFEPTIPQRMVMTACRILIDLGCGHMQGHKARMAVIGALPTSAELFKVGVKNPWD